MKQTDVKVGQSYLFYSTCTEHKKDMLGTVVKVISSKGSKRKVQNQDGILYFGKSPKRFKLDNGRYANAGELKPCSSVHVS